MALVHHPSASSHPTTSIFHQFHQFFEFLHMCAPILVTTTHLGMPSPPIIDWHTPHPPPGLVPSHTHRFLSNNHNLFSNLSTFRFFTHTHAPSGHLHPPALPNAFGPSTPPPYHLSLGF